MCRTSVVGSMAGRPTSSDSVGCSACGELGVSWHAAIHTAAEAGRTARTGTESVPPRQANGWSIAERWSSVDSGLFVPSDLV